jgi:hypothetical protein
VDRYARTNGPSWWMLRTWLRVHAGYSGSWARQRTIQNKGGVACTNSLAVRCALCSRAAARCVRLLVPFGPPYNVGVGTLGVVGPRCVSTS